MNSLHPGAIFALAALLATSTLAQTPQPSEHPLFKSIAGRWNGEGSLKTRDNGELKVHEEWTAAAEEGGAFRFAGTRVMGEETHEFSWLFLLNTTSGAYECEYEHTGMDQPMRFEVSITETRVELKSPLGGPGSHEHARGRDPERHGAAPRRERAGGDVGFGDPSSCGMNAERPFRVHPA